MSACDCQSTGQYAPLDGADLFGSHKYIILDSLSSRAADIRNEYVEAVLLIGQHASLPMIVKALVGMCHLTNLVFSVPVSRAFLNTFETELHVSMLEQVCFFMKTVSMMQ